MQQLSPEMYPWRRLSAVVYRKKKLSMDEDGPAFASISLPLQPTGEEMAHLQAKYREAIMTPDGATRSVSQLDLVSPSHTHASWLQRPRSASVCSENLQLTRASRSPKKRPSFRISRSRSSSMKIGRKAKSSIETTDNGAGCISVVDSILLKVKEQLVCGNVNYVTRVEYVLTSIIQFSRLNYLKRIAHFRREWTDYVKTSAS